MDQRKKVTITVSSKAIVSERENEYLLKIPNGKYGGYTFILDKLFVQNLEDIKNEENKEGLLKIDILLDKEISIYNGNVKQRISGVTLADALDKKTDSDYLMAKLSVNIRVPNEAIYSENEDTLTLITPKFTDIPNHKMTILKSYVVDRDLEYINFVIPNGSSFLFTGIMNPDSEYNLTTYQVFKRFDNTRKEDYDYQGTRLNFEHGEFYYFSLPLTAIYKDCSESVLIRMPEGEYSDFCFFIPHNWIKNTEDRINFGIPRNTVLSLFTIEQLTNLDKSSFHVTPDHLYKEFTGKTDDDYKFAFNQETIDSYNFNDFSTNIKNIPDEMKKENKWVAFRVKFNSTANKYEKFPVNAKVGSGAKIDDPSTFSDFETACEYAHKFKCKCIGYALDGNNDISCLDLDHAIVDGEYSEKLNDVLAKAKDTYVEKSVSGEGAHVFFKLEDKDYRTFSKDNDLELYQKTHFITMTGDLLSNNKDLKSIKGTDLEKLIDNSFDKRTPFENVNERVKGIKVVEDKVVFDRAMNSSNGDKFSKLFTGQDLYNDKSRSDMSLMTLLAFYTNGNKEQMIRIFANSGLYRPNKLPSYYESTAIKAVNFCAACKRKNESKNNEYSKEECYEKER